MSDDADDVITDADLEEARARWEHPSHETTVAELFSSPVYGEGFRGDNPIRADVETYAEDTSGHEHKGKGKGGGQFVKKGAGNSRTIEDARGDSKAGDAASGPAHGEHGSRQVIYSGPGRWRANGVDIEIGSATPGPEGERIRRETEAAIFNLFNSHKQDRFPELVGAPPGSKVRVQCPGNPEVLYIGVEGPDGLYQASRTVRRDASGKLAMYNNFFYMDPKRTGQGTGSKIFIDQVASCRAHGFSKIVTLGGRASRGQKMNGYYTWPRLGYDGPIAGKLSKRLPPELASATTVQHLMGLPGGREFWKKHGKSIDLQFDLSPGSASLDILEAYQREKARQSAVAKHSESGPSDADMDLTEDEGQRVGEEPDLSPADERALDVLWDQRAGEAPDALTYAERPPTDGERLAVWYAALLNDLSSVGTSPSNLLDGADDELDGSGWGLDQDDETGQWEARPEGDSDDPRAYAEGDWQPYIGRRGPRAGQQVGWQRGGRVVYGDRKPGSRARRAPAAKPKRPQASSPPPPATGRTAEHLAARLQAHAAQLTPEQAATARRSLAALRGHHGEGAVERAHQIADTLEQGLLDLPRSRLPAERRAAVEADMRQRLAHLHHIAGLAQPAGATPAAAPVDPNLANFRFQQRPETGPAATVPGLRASTGATTASATTAATTRARAQQVVSAQARVDAAGREIDRAHRERLGPDAVDRASAEYLAANDALHDAVHGRTPAQPAAAAPVAPQATPAPTPSAGRPAAAPTPAPAQPDPARPEETGFTGIADNGHRYVNGRQVALEQEPPAGGNETAAPEDEDGGIHLGDDDDEPIYLGDVDDDPLANIADEPDEPAQPTPAAPSSPPPSAPSTPLSADDFVHGLGSGSVNLDDEAAVRQHLERMPLSQQQAIRDATGLAFSREAAQITDPHQYAANLASRLHAAREAVRQDVSERAASAARNTAAAAGAAPAGPARRPFQASDVPSLAGRAEDPPHVSEDLRVSVNPTDLETAKAVIGKDLTANQMAAMANAVGNAATTIRVSRNQVDMSTSGDGYSCSRTFTRHRNGKVEVHNNVFSIRDDTPFDGHGVSLFLNQIRALRAGGVDYMTTDAAGDFEQAQSGGFNGYYTWPRFGADGEMSSRQIAALPAKLRQQLGRKKNIQSLYALPGGKEAWELHGGFIQLKFDLKDGSPNLELLNRYIEERRARPERPRTRDTRPVQTRIAERKAQLQRKIDEALR